MELQLQLQLELELELQLELELELDRVSGQLTVTENHTKTNAAVQRGRIVRQQSNFSASPSLPASCSWIFSISMGVVTTTWQVPAPHPASTSPHRGKYL